MSFKEFRRSCYQGDTCYQIQSGLFICLCEPLTAHTTKVLAITAKGNHLVGICDHTTEHIQFTVIAEHPEHNKSEAIQKFISIV